MKQDKQMLAMVNKLQKKSKASYDAKQKELAKIPNCGECSPKECSSCVKDLTSKDCKFKPMSKDMRRLVTYAMLGSLAEEFHNKF